MKILDGKSLSSELMESVQEDVKKLQPSLTVVLVGNNPASLSYVKSKKKYSEIAGINYDERRFPDTITQEELLQVVEELNNDNSVTGFIVQTPLPDHINPSLIIRAIDPKKDVDGWHAYNLGKMFLSSEFEDLPPATPAGIIKLLDHYDIQIEGKEVVVVGHSNVVGKPISIMLLNRNATVTTCHIYTQDLASHTQRADILIVAVGKANLITADMVKDGVVVVDVGINRTDDGKLCGDVDFENVSKKASFISPVPGGVGPMTVAALIMNTVNAAKRQKKG